MPNAPHKNPHYALRIEETTMDKLRQHRTNSV